MSTAMTEIKSIFKDFKRVFSNKWVKFGISFINIIYLVLLIAIAYSTFLYTLVFNSQVSFVIVYFLINAIFFALMIYTRKMFVTRFIAMIMLPIVFLIVLFNLNNWVLYAFPFVIGVVMFFVCRANVTLKTLLGTMYIIMYFVGLVAFSLVGTLFGGSQIETVLDRNLPLDSEVMSVYDKDKLYTVLDSSVSADGRYRYYLVDVQDKDRGKTQLYIEPNDKDIHYNFFTLYDKGRERLVSYGERGVIPDIEWVYEQDENGDIRAVKIKSRYGNDGFKTTNINIPKKNYFDFLY